MMGSDLAWRVEMAELNSFPSVRQVLLGGWVLRFSEGGPRRGANSASPLCSDCDDGDRLIDTAAMSYRRRGSPPLFRIPSIIPDAIDARLAARGCTAEGESCVLYGPITAIAAERDSSVRLLAAPTPRWSAAMAAAQGRTPKQSAVYRRIVHAIALPAAFAVLSIKDEPAVLAYAAIHDGLLSYQSVVTDRRYRRLGLARRVLATLAAWGRDNGAKAACLQVEADNAPARAF